MSFSAPHIDFVLASYGFTVAILCGLIVTTLWRARKATQRIQELEARAVSRRKPAKPVTSK